MSASLTELLNDRKFDEAAQLVETHPELANDRCKTGARAAQVAMYSGQTELALRLATLASPDFATAVTVGNLSQVQLLLSEDPTLKDTLSADGFTPLSLAAAFGKNDVLLLLIEAGADPEARSTALGGVAPLHAAVFGRNQVGVEALLKAGVDVNAPQSGGFTALHGAAQNQDETMVKTLLRAGADIQSTTEAGKRALDFAVNAEIVALLESTE